MTAAISATGRPSRFCNWNWKPPPVPSPMIGGRLKGTTSAGTCAVPRATAASNAFTFASGAVRSEKVFSVTIKKALFDCARPFSIEKPVTLCTA